MTGTELETVGANPLAVLANPAVHKQLERALKPSGIATDYFVRVLQTEVRKNVALQRCTPESFMGAMMLSAELGLRIGILGEAYLIPRKGEAQFQAGYQGLMKLARNAHCKVACGVVYDGDTFDYELGSAPYFTHKPSLTVDHAHKNIVAVWAMIETAGGERIPAMMNHADVLKHRERYAQKVNGRFNAPWLYDTEGGQFDQMALKTVIIKAMKFAPKSTQMERAYQAEMEAEPAYDVDGDAEPVEEAKPQPRATKAALGKLDEQMTRTGVPWESVQEWLNRHDRETPDDPNDLSRPDCADATEALRTMPDKAAMPNETVDAQTGEVLDAKPQAEAERVAYVASVVKAMKDGPVSNKALAEKLAEYGVSLVIDLDGGQLESYTTWHDELAKAIRAERAER